MTDASLPLDCARNPRKLALLRQIPEEKRAGVVAKVEALVEELRHRKREKPKARQD